MTYFFAFTKIFTKTMTFPQSFRIIDPFISLRREISFRKNKKHIFIKCLLIFFKQNKIKFDVDMAFKIVFVIFFS